MTSRIPSLTFACSLLGIVPGFAASIWTNPITAANPSSSNPFTTGDVKNANITVSGIGRGSGIVASAAANIYQATGWESAAFNANDYFSWTLTPNSGFEIDFTSLVFTATLPGNGPANFSFRSNAGGDNFATNIDTPTGAGDTISLSAAAYQNITGPIEFRLYGWNANNASRNYGINDFTFDATVSAVVPEPSSAAMLSLIGCLGLVRRRR